MRRRLFARQALGVIGLRPIRIQHLNQARRQDSQLGRAEGIGVRKDLLLACDELSTDESGWQLAKSGDDRLRLGQRNASLAQRRPDQGESVRDVRGQPDGRSRLSGGVSHRLPHPFDHLTSSGDGRFLQQMHPQARQLGLDLVHQTDKTIQPFHHRAGVAVESDRGIPERGKVPLPQLLQIAHVVYYVDDH